MTWDFINTANVAVVIASGALIVSFLSYSHQKKQSAKAALKEQEKEAKERGYKLAELIGEHAALKDFIASRQNDIKKLSTYQTGRRQEIESEIRELQEEERTVRNKILEFQSHDSR